MQIEKDHDEAINYSQWQYVVKKGNDSIMNDEVLQNEYEDETHPIIGKDISWAIIENSSGLENFISLKLTNRVSSEPNSIGVIVAICQIIQSVLRPCQFIPSNQLITFKELRILKSP